MRALLPPDSVAAKIRRDLAPFGVLPAADDEVAAAQAFAQGLIGGTIVSAEDLGRLQRLSGAALFLAKEVGEITGVLAFVLLNAAGLRAVLEDRFDAVSPPSAQVARPDERVRAMYGWGIAASTRDSARRLLDGARVMGRNAVAHLAHYARPTTAAGERLMRERLEFVDVPGSRSGLVWKPAFLDRARAA